MERKGKVGGIVLSERFKLVPCEGRNASNWELCELRGGSWRGMGRYYQSGTFHLALRYAANRVLADGCRDDEIGLSEAIDRYEKVVVGMANEIKASCEDRN